MPNRVDREKNEIIKPSLLILSVVFSISYFVYNDFGIKVRVGIAILLVAVCFSYINQLANGRVFLRKLEQKYLILTLSIIFLALLPHARINHDTMAVMFSLFLSCLFVMVSCPQKKEISISMRIIVFSGLILSIYVISVAAFPEVYSLISGHVSANSREFANSMLDEGYGIFIGSSPVHIVYILSFAIFVLVSRAALEPAKIRVITLLELAILMLALLLENRKTELVATTIVALFLFFTKYNYTTARKRKNIRRTFLAAVVTAAAMIPIIIRLGMLNRYVVFFERILNNNRYGTNIDVSSGRVYLWRKAIELFKDYPAIGIGWGRFSDYVEDVGHSFDVVVNNVHNNYLQLLCETGIVGFIIVVSLFVSVLYESIKIAKSLENRETNSMLRTAASAGIGFQLFMLIVSFLDPIWYKVVFWWFYSVAVSFLIGANNNAKNTGVTNEDINSVHSSIQC